MKRPVRALGKLNCGKMACCVFVLCSTTAIALPAQTFTTLFSFDGLNGSGTEAALIQGADGNLYGTTGAGGANISPVGHRAGTIFELTSDALETLYNFCPNSGCADGSSPYAPLLQTIDGEFYGTTLMGGAYPGYSGLGAGTIFKLSAGGTLATLYDFCAKSQCTDGEYPRGTLVEASNGDLYGVTQLGGVTKPFMEGQGTIFKITPGGALTTLHRFCAMQFCPDGANPYGLVEAANGDFYGTTPSGGAYGHGSIFSITPGGAFATVYSFCSGGINHCTDGEGTGAGLTLARDGNLYGTTEGGGPNGGGTIFRITPGGDLTTLYSFCGTSFCPGGSIPEAALVQASDGNLYGTTVFGGAYDFGTIFRITPGGVLTTLYNFCPQTGCADGIYPQGALLQATNGEIYGTTAFGGAFCPENPFGAGCGTVFKLSMGLPAFVKPQPAFGNAGVAIQILGTNLTAASSVTFNGTAAEFTVVSGSLITATVPAGAASGAIEVVTPGGTLSSNVPFRVRP